MIERSPNAGKQVISHDRKIQVMYYMGAPILLAGDLQPEQERGWEKSASTVWMKENENTGENKA